MPSLGLTLGPYFHIPSGGGSSFVGALDDYTSLMLGAYSLARRLLTSYEGPMIRLRRSSDNAEQDIGATEGGDLDESAITSFVGSNSAFVTTIYDQSGSSNDAIQNTASAQPRIVNTGTLYTIGGKAGCQFDGTNDNLAIAGITTGEVLAYSTIIKSTNATWNDFGSVFEVAADGGGTSRLGLMASGGTAWHVDPTIAACRKNGTALSGPSFNMTTINNAMVLGVDTNAVSLTPTATLVIGSLATTYYLAFGLSEIVAWSSVADRTAFEANQKLLIGA